MVSSVIFDIICVALIVICAAYFAAKGLLAGLLSLVGTLVCLVASFFAGRELALPVFNGLFRDRLIQSTSDAIAEHAVTNINELLDQVVGFLPDFVKQPIIDQFGTVTLFDSWDFATRVVDEVISPLIVPIIAVVLFVIVFILLRLLFNIITKLLRGVNRVPVIGTANRVLGGVAGIVVGLLYVFLLVVVLSALSSLYGSELDPGGLFGRSIFYRLFSHIQFFPRGL